MDRMKGVTMADAGWITKLAYRAAKRRIGLVPKSKALAAYNTPGLLASTWMDAICGSAKSIPITLKELAQLKVATLAGCLF